MKNHIKPISLKYPLSHSYAGEPTYFIEGICKNLYMSRTNSAGEVSAAYSTFFENESIKRLSHHNWDFSYNKAHTIREGDKVQVGDTLSLYAWTGRPYHTSTVKFELKLPVVKTFKFELRKLGKATYEILINDKSYAMYTLFEDGSIKSIDGGRSYENLRILATNDGFVMCNYLMHWFKKPFVGQIICWDPSIKY